MNFKVQHWDVLQQHVIPYFETPDFKVQMGNTDSMTACKPTCFLIRKESKLKIYVKYYVPIEKGSATLEISAALKCMQPA